MTYGQAKTKTIQLLDQYSISGSITSPTDGNTLDYTLKFPSLFDTAQKEIATTTKFIHAVKKISQNPVANLMGDKFNTVPYLMTDIVDMAYVGARSYYFEVDGMATIYIEEETATDVWTVLNTLSNAVQGFYTALSGFITPSLATNTVRLRFSGLYPYNIRNRALYLYTYPTVDNIPVFTRYISYDLPSDFGDLNKVLLDGQRIIGWEWQGKSLAIDYYARGDIEVWYYKIPADIPSDVLDGYSFELDEEAAQCIPYYAASECFRTDPQNMSVSVQLFSIYQGKMANLINRQLDGQRSVKNTLFSGSISNYKKFF